VITPTLTAIRAEQARAAQKHGDLSMSGASMTDFQRITVLAEELGEVSRAALDGDRAQLRAELVQLAGAALAWCERLEARS
jgi:NTP pyrophosphatase (non-canonical NTP hydrolase)